MLKSEPNTRLLEEPCAEQIASVEPENVAGLAKEITSKNRLDPVSFLVHAVFILSGVSALIYQLVWQRSLMLIYGSNVESVAMVVAAFMMGLGLGSIAG